MNSDFDAREVYALVDPIRPILAGHHPVLQSAALADLLAIWLAGHPAHLREDVLEAHIRLVRALVPANVKAMKGSSDEDQ